MPEHNYDNVPVHVRTKVDSETGDEYIMFGLELDGVFFHFYSAHGEQFQKVFDELRAARGVEGGAA